MQILPGKAITRFHRVYFRTKEVMPRGRKTGNASCVVCGQKKDFLPDLLNKSSHMRSILTNAHQELATVTIAIDFDAKIANSLNKAADYFNSELKGGELLFGNNYINYITVRSREPHWAATVGYTRVQFTCLPVTFFLDSFREVTSCIFNAAKFLGVEQLGRIGLQITSWRPLPAIDYHAFTQSFAELSMRPSFLQSFLFHEFDLFVKVEGVGKTDGIRYSANVAPMNIGNVRDSLKSLPAIAILALNRELTDELALKFYNSVLHNSLFVDIDVSKKDIRLEQVRDTAEMFYENAEERIESISKMMGVS